MQSKHRPGQTAKHHDRGPLSAAAIDDLPALVAALPPPLAERWQRLFHLEVSKGTLNPPDRMQAWIERSFGSVEAVLHQQVVRVTNRLTLEGAAFNPLRGQRPQQGRYQSDIDQIIAATAGAQDDSGFCAPESGTPEDIFGRVRGRYCLTASNIAKYDGWHGVLIFDQHHPLSLTSDRIEDYIHTALRWFDAVHTADPAALYPFFMWNCLWRSGASVIHGHAQMSMASGMAYPKIEALRQAAERYGQQTGQGYFDHLWSLHQALGLALHIPEPQLAGYVSLTPVKEKEVVLFGNDPIGLARSLYQVMDCFIAELGVQSFNVSLVLPPPADTAESWEAMPIIARIVDRGDPNSRGSDIGAMELYATPIISSDPFAVARALAGRFP
ncbi:MAG TPA: hypothetical protein VGE07_11890 [Herpetosiphonaceae bacterium]